MLSEIKKGGYARVHVAMLYTDIGPLEKLILGFHRLLETRGNGGVNDTVTVISIVKKQGLSVVSVFMHQVEGTALIFHVARINDDIRHQLHVF